MIEYRCQTCGLRFTMSADAWMWHRLVEHPAMGLPVHDPRRTSTERDAPIVTESELRLLDGNR